MQSPKDPASAWVGCEPLSYKSEFLFHSYLPSYSHILTNYSHRKKREENPEAYNKQKWIYHSMGQGGQSVIVLEAANCDGL